MREIKFRGLDIIGNWYIGNLAILTQTVNGVIPGKYISNSVGCPFAYQIRPETVGEFTGLRDKNGKEIYESDVVEFLWTPYNPREVEPAKQTRTGSIIWCDGAFMLDNVSMGTIERIDSWSWQLEVIGNIHEDINWFTEAV